MGAHFGHSYASRGQRADVGRIVPTPGGLMMRRWLSRAWRAVLRVLWPARAEDLAVRDRVRAYTRTAEYGRDLEKLRRAAGL